MITDSSRLKFDGARGFLVVDGVNGAGKGTLITKLHAYLLENGIDPLLTREPGGTLLGKTLREILLSNSSTTRSPLSEVFLFCADRTQHVSEVIRPAIERCQPVISDRYYYSTIAFQGYGRELDLATIKELSRIAICGTTPDLVLLLDLDPAVGLRRTAKRSEGADSFEAEELAFHQRLRAGFLKLAEELPEPFCVLDASQTPDQVFESAKAILNRWIESLKR